MSALALPVLIEPLFHAAGWRPSQSFLAQTALPADAMNAASQIIEEFDGLEVGECSCGTEQAASDVRFASAIRPLAPSSWRKSLGELWVFAYAHHDHMQLCVGQGGHFYIFTDPDERLYDAGSDFSELMRKLLWGYKYGPELRRDV